MNAYARPLDTSPSMKAVPDSTTLCRIVLSSASASPRAGRHHRIPATTLPQELASRLPSSHPTTALARRVHQRRRSSCNRRPEHVVRIVELKTCNRRNRRNWVRCTTGRRGEYRQDSQCQNRAKARRHLPKRGDYLVHRCRYWIPLSPVSKNRAKEFPGGQGALYPTGGQ